MEEQSVTQLIQRVASGEQGEVQDQLVERFLHRLTALARSRLQDVRGYEDEHDVALSAMKSFLMRAPDEGSEAISDRNALWSLLAAITIRKSITVRRRMLSQKRDVRRARSLHDLLHHEPTKEFLDSVSDEANQLLESLDDPTLKTVARLRMEGYDNRGDCSEDRSIGEDRRTQAAADSQAFADTVDGGRMMHCHRFRPVPLTRREMLTQAADGFGAVALTALAGSRTRASCRAASLDGQASPCRAPGSQRHISLHGWRAIAGRHV